jgi:uncharacterized phage protein (predicted DNA packaging)
MKVSELTPGLIKDYCREDYDDSDDLIVHIMLPAAKAFICSHTGLKSDELDDYEDITVALLAIVAEMHDSRRLTVDNNTLNPLAKGILDLHDRNLIGGVEHGED